MHHKKFFLLVCTLLVHVFVMAQDVASQTAPDKSGLMRSEGKIYVAMAVAITILAGLILYIIRLDRKMTKFEKGNL